MTAISINVAPESPFRFKDPQHMADFSAEDLDRVFRIAVAEFAMDLDRVTEEDDPDRPCLPFFRTSWVIRGERERVNGSKNPRRNLVYDELPPLTSDLNTAFRFASGILARLKEEGRLCQINLVSSSSEPFVWTALGSEGVAGSVDVELVHYFQAHSPNPALALAVVLAFTVRQDVPEIAKELLE